jgi:4-hydroxybenzoate polyprenyltransferase
MLNAPSYLPCALRSSSSYISDSINIPTSSPPKSVAFTLPEYQSPKYGILSHVPASWIPYGELARIDKPVGIWLFYYPHLFGTLFVAACCASPLSIEHVLWINLKLFLGAAFVRAAACAWNDNLDREFDRKVRRCRLRPIARGALTPTQGHVFTGVLTVIAAAILITLPMACMLVAVPSVALLVLYPFAKRFTDFPQVILGFQLALAIPMGMAAVDPDFLNNGAYDKGAVMALYLMNVAWTLVYDTVYAQQDVEDDKKAGVRSMAVRFRDRPKTLLTVIVVVQLTLLSLTGQLQGFGVGYFGAACGGSMVSMLWMLTTIDLKEPAQCGRWFRRGCWTIGLSVSCGLALEAMP